MSSPLLVLYTGGTLGMVTGPDGLEPGHNLTTRLRAQLATLPVARRNALPEWLLESMGTPFDSSSARPEHWVALATRIRHYIREHAPGGIVVLHGTDTMAWCTTLLSVMLEDVAIECPVVVTGAQRPLEADGSDARDNVELALRYAAHSDTRGVVLAFGEHLLAGDAARKWFTQDYRGFVTPNAAVLASWSHDARDEHAPPTPLPCVSSAARQRVADLLQAEPTRLDAEGLLPRVARIVLWPGIDANQVDALLKHADAAVLEVWGSGNLPNDPALHQVLMQAGKEGKPMVALSQCPHGSTHISVYAAGQAIKAAGIIEGGDLTPELASALLLCAPQKAPA